MRGRVTWKRGTAKVTPVSRRDGIVQAMVQTEDKVRGITFHNHSGAPKTVNQASDVECYIAAKSTSDPQLRLRIVYVGEELLGIQEFLIEAGGKRLSLKPQPFDVKNDFAVSLQSSKTWEWWDTDVGDKEREFVETIAQADRVTLRYSGREYSKDRELSGAEIERMKTVLAAYKIMGGK